MLKELPRHTVATEIPHYEHLDFLWGQEVDKLVFPHVFDALNSFSGAEHTKEEYDRYRSARHQSLGVGGARPAGLDGYFSEQEPTPADGSGTDVGSGGSGGDSTFVANSRQRRARVTGN